MRSGFEIAQWIEFLQDRYGDEVARDYMNLSSEEFMNRRGEEIEREIEHDQRQFEVAHPLR